MNNNGDGKIPMIGQEKRDKWKKILPELLAVILCLVLMGAGVSRKEGYHMDELLSFELANARYNPWIVPTQPEGRLAKFVNEEIEGDSAGEALENLKNTVTDVLRNRGNSKLLSYKADVYEEPVWITDRQFQDYVTVDQKDAFDYLSVYFNVCRKRSQFIFLEALCCRWDFLPTQCFIKNRAESVNIRPWSNPLCVRVLLRCTVSIFQKFFLAGNPTSTAGSKINQLQIPRFIKHQVIRA